MPQNSVVDPNPDYSSLLSEGRIGTLVLPNRVLMTAMGSDLADGDGVAGVRMAEYYAARAKGEVALVISEAVAVAYPYGYLRPNSLALSEERHVVGIQRIADAVHREGGRFCVQLNHNGHKALQDVVQGRPLWGPSAPPEGAEHIAGATRYHDMTHEDIASVAARFGSAAGRARRAGADAVEIHAAHGYLLSQFLSPFTNSRTDEYGGSVENRSRLLVEVLRAVRAEVGHDFPVWCKIDSREFLLSEGITVEDAKTTALLAQEAGADAINASAYADPRAGAWGMAMSHSPVTPGHLLENAAAIRAVVDIPVISAGRVSPELAELHIGAGKLDFIAMGRNLLADPELPRKIREGRRADVRPCMYGLWCLSEASSGGVLRCSVNPETGRETELEVRRSQRRRRLVVVGGGPAGMEASRRLAMAGHEVTLFERNPSLGGMLRLAAPTYEPNERLLTWLRGQVEQLEIDVRLGTFATREALEALAPEGIILATGGRPSADGVTVEDGARTVRAADLQLADEALTTAGHVVVIGGGISGLSLAVGLGARGWNVTVLHEGRELGTGFSYQRREMIFRELDELRVTVIAGATGIRATAATVGYLTARHQTRTLRADICVLARDNRADPEMLDAFSGLAPDVRIIGDAREIGHVDGALLDAAVAARALG